MLAEGFRDKIFNTEIVRALGHALSDENPSIRCRAVKFFTTAVPQGALHCFHTEIFVEGFRDKVFDTEIVVALGQALDDTSSIVRSKAVEMFTAAMAQGALRCFCGIFIPQYLQRTFGPTYLILGSLPQLDVH